MKMQQMKTFIFSLKKEARYFQIQVLWSKIYLHSHNSPEAHNQSRIGLEYKIRLQSQKCNLWQKKSSYKQEKENKAFELCRPTSIKYYKCDILNDFQFHP